MRRVAASIALLVWLVLATRPGQLQAAPAACDQPAPETPGVYLGAWVPAARDDARPLEQDPLGRLNGAIGKRLAIVQRWEHWGLENDGNVDAAWMRRVAEAGAFPMLTWVPWNPDLSPPETQQGFLLRDIAAGAHDGYVVAAAREIARWDGPLFIRFAQEMNGTWYPWGKHQNSPEEYVAAWRHVHELFEQHGAGHVTWVWNVSEKNHPETLGLWYPGDDVVDWVAVDGYNWDDPAYFRDRQGDTWRTLDQVFGPSFSDIASFAPDKPAMIAETATTERPGDPELKAIWICDAFRRALPEALPNVQAVLWFQEQKSEAGRPYFWLLDTSEASREAFGAAVALGYYVGDLGDLPTRFGQRKVPPPAALLGSGG